MACSMISSSNNKRKYVSSKTEVDDDTSFVESDWFSLDFEDFISNTTSIKKRKTMESFIDQELEDTASSPIQSPKVNDFNLFYMKSKELDSRDICEEKEHTTQKIGDYTKMSLLLESELRKKGLCLIPTSMLLNYLTTNVI